MKCRHMHHNISKNTLKELKAKRSSDLLVYFSGDGPSMFQSMNIAEHLLMLFDDDFQKKRSLLLM